MKRVLAVFLMLVAFNGFAFQKHLVGKDLVTLTVSQFAFSEISIVNEGFLTVQWEGDNLEYKKDEGKGKIFIKPKTDEVTPIKMNIVTKNKHQINLLLLPANIPAEQIKLVVEGSKQVANNWEKNTPYNQAITTLIKAMYNGEYLSGFSVDVVKVKKQLIAGLKPVSLTRYYGDKLLGEVILLKNNSKYLITINEGDFKVAGVRAVSVENKEVASKNIIRVFRVINNG